MCLSSPLVPDSFLCGTVSSMLKHRKAPFNCNPHRSITVACNLSKVFEYILLPHIKSNYEHDVNQFGFKSCVGCQHAQHTLATLLQDAQTNGHELCICTLDLAKAFDSVCHAQLWYTFAVLGVNWSIILLLHFWYLVFWKYPC